MDGYQSNQRQPYAWRGQVRPQYPKPSATPPLWKGDEIIGVRGEYFTGVTIKLMRPTVEYPETAINLIVKNGNASTFAKLKIDDLRKLVVFISNAITAIEPLLPACIKAEQEVMASHQMLNALQSGMVDLPTLMAQLQAQAQQGKPDEQEKE